jgi:hypothetical protein
MTHTGQGPRTTHGAAGAFRRAVRRAIAPIRLAFCGLALGAVGTAYLGRSTSQQGLARESLSAVATRPLAAGSAPSCPLPLGQQVKAVKAFGEMMPVFRHPRCSNCHGAFDIRSAKHPGKDVANFSGLDPRALLTAQQRKELHDGCGDCHDNVEGSLTRLDGTKLEGWLVAPLPMLWDGKSDEELCMQMKRFEPTGDQFVDHLKTDHNEIQFIKAAFNGDRALGTDGLEFYKLVAEKPPGDTAALVEKARKWVELVGDGYTASPECGCVMPKIKLQIQHRSEIDPSHIKHRGGWAGFSGDAAFEVTLAPVEQTEGLYWGQASLVRPLRVYWVNKACRGTASQKEHWWFRAEVDEKTNAMTLQFGFTTSDEKGESVCKIGGYVDRAEIYPDMFSDLERLVMPLDSGATKQETLREPTGEAQEWLTVKVIAVPKGQ